MISVNKIFSLFCVGYLLFIVTGSALLDSGSDAQINGVLVGWVTFTLASIVWLHRAVRSVPAGEVTLGYRLMLVAGYLIAIPTLFVGLFILYFMLTFSSAGHH